MTTSSPAGTDSLFDALYTQRAIRKFKPDPVPRELLWKVLEAATKAPSGTNRQPWRWIVVEDAARRAGIAKALEAHLQTNDAMRTYFESGATSDDKSTRLMLSGALALAHNVGVAPVLVIPCYWSDGNRIPDRLLTGSSLYPAVQNLLLAARGLGLGTVLTTFQSGILEHLRAEIGIPEEAFPAALIPLGWPDANFGPTSRKPVDEVVYWESWGTTAAR
ncbi:MAG: nitroreductase family protein [Dehalococcoidia bacterium]